MPQGQDGQLAPTDEAIQGGDLKFNLNNLKVRKGSLLPPKWAANRS